MAANAAKAAPLSVEAFDLRWASGAPAFGGSQSTTATSCWAPTGGDHQQRVSVRPSASTTLLARPVSGFALAGAARISTRQIACSGNFRPVSRPSLRGSTARRVRFHRGRARLGWQDVTTNRNVTCSASTACAQFKTTLSSGLSKAATDSQPPSAKLTPYAACVHQLPPALLHGVRSRSSAGTFALNYAGKDVTSEPQRAVARDREFIRAGRPRWSPARPSRLGARLQHRAMSRRPPGSAGLVRLRRQLCGAPPPTRAHHRAAEWPCRNGWSASATATRNSDTTHATHKRRGSL